MNIIYNSTVRLCAELDGVVVHVEKGAVGGSSHSRTGGPRSGNVVGHLVDGRGLVEPRPTAVRGLIDAAMAVA